MEKSCPTIRFDIYMAGDINLARDVCRRFCFNEGFCVHIEAADFIYTGGEERGFKIGIINYPRFPLPEEKLRWRAEILAKDLMERLCQHSYCIIGKDETIWFTRRNHG